MQTPESKKLLQVKVIFLALLAITLALYWPVRNHDFITYDDYNYITDNAIVKQGLTWNGFLWAFGYHASNWHPLTWMSHMLDCQLFGLDAGKHHLVNVLIHAINGSLLFLALYLMTGFTWRSAFVAALFLWHPLHVESAAWVAERKDVLSGFFFMTLLLTWTRYVSAGRRGNAAESAEPKSDVTAAARQRRPTSSKWYYLTLLLFALGLMSKPMLVTVPFVLLLVDFWPLNRFAEGENFRTCTLFLVKEKIPFFLLSALVCLTTVFAQKGAMVDIQIMSFKIRIENAFIAYAQYIWKLIRPVDLSIFYPHPGQFPFWKLASAVALVFLLTVFAVAFLRRRPWRAMGWFWFLGMLVPVIGLVQVGEQSMADRYTYLPAIGLFILVAWEIGNRFPRMRLLHFILSAVVMSACILTTRAQIACWQNGRTIMEHALEMNPKNIVILNNLGAFYDSHGDFEAAIKEYKRALDSNPQNYSALDNLGCIALQQGRTNDAIDYFTSALKIKPNDALTLNNLGSVMMQQGKLEQALNLFQSALKADTDSLPLQINTGNTLQLQGKYQEANAYLQKALHQNPKSSEAHQAMGVLLEKMGHPDLALPFYSQACALSPTNAYARACHAYSLVTVNRLPEALKEYCRALELNPNLQKALNELAWLLATCPQEDLRNGSEAVRLAEKACQLTSYADANCLSALDAAYAEAGRYTEAIAAAQKTSVAFEKAGLTNLSQMALQRAELYRAGKPFHSGQK